MFAPLRTIAARTTLLLTMPALVALTQSPAHAATETFTSPGEHPFVVPAGVTSIQIAAVGGKGGSGNDGYGASFGPGGFGATAAGTVPVTPGQHLFVEVGGNGGTSTSPGARGSGGFNGGAEGGGGVLCPNPIVAAGGGGGGASDVRTSSRAVDPLGSSRLVTAGGGGGGGSAWDDDARSGGGPGGTPIGGTGEDGSGNDTPPAPGGAGGGGGASGGPDGLPGDSGRLQDGSCRHPGGGGGGGQNGGGGGVAHQFGGGGGGGGSSAFAATTTATSTSVDTTGMASVTITYGTPPPVASADTDGDGLTDSAEVAGISIAKRVRSCDRTLTPIGAVKTDPTKADTDGDGLSDGQEVNGVNVRQKVLTPKGRKLLTLLVSNPTTADTDGDGLSDRIEVTGSANKAFRRGKTDPSDCHTDGGRQSDGKEIRHRRNPTVAGTAD